MGTNRFIQERMGSWHRKVGARPVSRLHCLLAALVVLQKLARQLLASPPPDPDADIRRDLTHLTVFTVDDESTTEIDDGLSIERWVGVVCDMSTYSKDP